MIHRLNEQVLDSQDSHACTRERKQDATQRRNTGNVTTGIQVRSERLSPETSTLRNLVEEITNQPNSTQPSGGLSAAKISGEGTVSNDSDIDGGEADNRPAKKSKIV